MEWIKCSDRMPEKSGEYLVASDVKESGYRIFTVIEYSSKWGMWNTSDYRLTREDAELHTDAFRDTEYWAEIPEVEE